MRPHVDVWRNALKIRAFVSKLALSKLLILFLTETRHMLIISYTIYHLRKPGRQHVT